MYGSIKKSRFLWGFYTSKVRYILGATAFLALFLALYQKNNSYICKGQFENF